MRHFLRGGVGIVRAESVTVQPTEPSDNEVEVNGDNYSINRETTEVSENDEYNSIIGGLGHETSPPQNNFININNGSVRYVYGGIANGLGGTFNNTVNIKGGSIGDVYGGYTIFGGVYNNTVNINGGSVVDVYGGYGSQIWYYDRITGSVKSNVVNINGGRIYNKIYGGYSSSDDLGQEVKDNAVNIYNNPDLSSATLFGYSNVEKHSGNTLNIYTKNLTARNVANFDTMNFYLDSNINSGDAMLTLTGGSQTDISSTDIQAVIQGGSPLSSGDTVTLMKNDAGITAAKSYTGTLAEGVSLTYPLNVYRNDDGTAILAQIGSSSDDNPTDDNPSDDNPTDNKTTDNTPKITNDSNNVKNIYDTDSGTIYGGYTTTGNASSNTVNLYGGTNLENLYGGYAPSGETSGNVLNVYNKNISAQNIYNFDNLNFYIPNDAASGDAMLTFTGSAATDLSGVSIRAGVLAGDSNTLTVGDTINLMTNSNGFITDSATNFGTLTEGVSLDYDLMLSNSGNSIVANVTDAPAALNPQTESLPLSGGTGIEIAENVLDTPTLPENSTIDFENDEGADSPQESSNIVIVEPKGWEIFANAGGGSLRTKAGNGSYVDMTSKSINLGFARSLESSSGRFTIAPIVDYAHGNYDSYLADGTHGTGSTRYIAGGLIARRMLQKGFYYETSIRAGKVKTDFASDNLDKTGVFGRVTYDTLATTVSGHLKLGKVFRLNKNNLLDVYSVYYHAHQNGMNTDLSSGEHYNFSSADSGRFRIGYRLTTRTSKISKIYTGLAYQYENASGITATYKNYETPSAGDGGSSGMLEIGWVIKPLKVSPWAVDINATGWVGHQRGITAMAKLQKAF